jgi:3',5'-cyclic AMP phosphodiesterase CpdA
MNFPARSGADTRPEFRLTQISDPHLARRLPTLTENFYRVSEYIDVTRPDIVVNSGDVSFDGPTNRDDLEFAKTLHAALPVECLTIPGNHDIGDNPTAVGPPPTQSVTPETMDTFVSIFGEDRWRFEAAGWCFIGMNSLVMNTGLAREAEQFDWLAAQLSAVGGKPLALFLHKPLYRNAPDDPELPATSIRYIPQPARAHLIEMLRAVDLRLVASGHLHQRRDFTRGHVRHVWAPSSGFIIPDKKQEVIGIKEVGLVEYCFQPDGFEVRHVRAPGQTDIDMDSLFSSS